MKKTEGYFIDHCDDPPCGLGRFNYECPVCSKWGDDYEVWYKDMEIWKGEKVNFKCENCKADLTTYWDKEEYEYYVIKKEEK